MPILGARSRRGDTATASSRDSASADLPPYEPLACALSEEAKRGLIALANGRDTRRYEDHIKKSVSYLGKNVAAVNDRVVERQAELEQLGERRAAKGGGKTAREENLEKWLPKLDSEVATISLNFEKAVRDLVDRQARMQDEKEATGAMARRFEALPSRQRPARRRQTEGDGNEENEEPNEPEELPPPDRDPLSILEEEIASKTAHYEEMGYYQRYSLNNDYAGFRKLWHDAKFGSQEVPLPDPTQWIDEQGNPVLFDQRRSGDANVKDDDDDLILEAEHESYVCGLSMQQITEPYSNRQCRHVFQKQVIIGWLNETGHRGRARQCPNPGCDKSFQLSDFYVDELVLRKIQRTRKREAEEEASGQDDDEDDDDDDDDDVDDVDTGPRQSIGVKPERKRRAVEKIEDDEDEVRYK